ncbi:hypothetical protein [Bradyrhizobium lablabi]|uniref:hypothetical protein n=1 Tax=Bradyrhizobium lablabi TaxID=722472 RepID=UPI001BA4A81A|nr:hypothetical protein [Bradyrhizobium lablabi]MBR0696740.1 hypothetical protein [Bradyrhizobium lablabi]
MQNGLRKKIDSIDQLEADLPSILERIHTDPELAIAAAVNPLLFLDEIGYSLSAKVSAEIEERSRFSRRQIARRHKAIAKIDEITKERADLSSPEAIVEIFAKLGLDDVRPDLGQTGGRASGVLDFSEDFLAENRTRHPLFGALLELRRIEANSRLFASDAIYRKIRSRRLAIPGLRLKARLSQKPKSSHSGRSGDRDA